MKELITIACAFLIVVGLALFMFISNDKHTTAVIKNNELNGIVEKQNEEIEALKLELQELKEHSNYVDSIYHKKINAE